MAVLGAQLVLSMVMASFLSKLSPIYSFARWVLCGRLQRFLHPSDDELRTLAGVPNSKGRGKKGDKKGPNETFTVPKNLNIQLDSTPVQAIDIIQLHYYTEYQWLMDFSVCAGAVYMLTEVYYTFVQPRTEVNLSMLWCLLVAGFSLKVLYSLTAMYFRTDEGGERIMCVIFGFFFLILAMGVLIVDERTLEFGLVAGYSNFSAGASEFLEKQGIESQGPHSLLTYRIMLAIFAAILGAFLTFPGLRLAKMHTDAVKYASESPLSNLFLHLNIIFPLLISLLWVKPIIRDQLVHGSYKLMDPDMFESLRVIIIIVFCLFRFLLVWHHLQAHLNMAVDRLEMLKKEAGRISSLDLQKTVTRVFFYLCVVALQYLAPVILLLFCAFMLKSLGHLSWARAFGIILGESAPAAKPAPIPVISNNASTISNTAAQFSIALANLKQVFTPVYFKGVFSFLCWWISTAWFTTSAFGMLYYNYMNL